MALLGRRKPSDNPTLALERELGELTSRRAVLETKLVEAAAAMVAATDARRQALLDADLSDEAAASRRDQDVRTTQDRHASLADALQALAAKISAAEARLGEERDRSERREIAALAQQEADALDRVREEFGEVAARLVTTMQATCARVPNVAPDLLPRVSAIIVSDLPIALAELVAGVRSYALRIESGHAPLIRPLPPPPELPPAPPLERRRAYCLVPLRWREGEQVVAAGRYSFADMPKAIAERAVAGNFADWPDAERTRKTMEGFGVVNAAPPPADLCVDLDALDRPMPAQALPEARIGPVRWGQISVPRS